MWGSSDTGPDGHVAGGSVAGEFVVECEVMSDYMSLTSLVDCLCHSTGAGKFEDTAEVACCGTDTPDRATFMCNVCNGYHPACGGASCACNVCHV